MLSGLLSVYPDCFNHYAGPFSLLVSALLRFRLIGRGRWCPKNNPRPLHLLSEFVSLLRVSHKLFSLPIFYLAGHSLENLRVLFCPCLVTSGCWWLQFYHCQTCQCILPGPPCFTRMVGWRLSVAISFVFALGFSPVSDLSRLSGFGDFLIDSFLGLCRLKITSRWSLPCNASVSSQCLPWEHLSG